MVCVRQGVASARHSAPSPVVTEAPVVAIQDGAPGAGLLHQELGVEAAGREGGDGVSGPPPGTADVRLSPPRSWFLLSCQQKVRLLELSGEGADGTLFSSKLGTSSGPHGCWQAWTDLGRGPSASRSPSEKAVLPCTGDGTRHVGP